MDLEDGKGFFSFEGVIPKLSSRSGVLSLKPNGRAQNNGVNGNESRKCFGVSSCLPGLRGGNSSAPGWTIPIIEAGRYRTDDRGDLEIADSDCWKTV